MTRFMYAYGYVTKERAEAALLDCFATGELSEGDSPKIISYIAASSQKRRWGIEIDG